MSTINHHHLARQSYIEALKDLARREAERKKASDERYAEAVARQKEEAERMQACKQASMENAVRITNRTP